jgi:hypothetical protein
VFFRLGDAEFLIVAHYRELRARYGLKRPKTSYGSS